MDGAVRCLMTRGTTERQRLCDVCAGAIFNVRLADDDAVRRQSHESRWKMVGWVCKGGGSWLGGGCGRVWVGWSEYVGWLLDRSVGWRLAAGWLVVG